jgi:hypothetical protein|tara:strand:- start:258 stop:386 length:129 start_codon:yes stop_codon:yes gene_type:complete
MSNSSEQFVSRTFAHFLLDCAETTEEIMAVLDDIKEARSDVL